MSKTEDDTATGSRAAAANGVGADSEVVPESDWSVDDDDPVDRPERSSVGRDRSADTSDRPSSMSNGQRSNGNRDDRRSGDHGTGADSNRTASSNGHRSTSSSNTSASSRRNRERRRRLNEKDGLSATGELRQTPREADRSPDYEFVVPETGEAPIVESPPTNRAGDDEITGAFDDGWNTDPGFVSAPSASYYGTPAAGVAIPEPDHSGPRRRRVRRAHRVLRHIDPWSTFKVGLIFNIIGYLVAMTSGVLLWNVADRTGTISNIERWFTQFGWETFEFKGSEIFTNAAIGGIFVAVGLTGALVMLATIFNLVSDAIGGIRLTVLEEEYVALEADDAIGFSGASPVSSFSSGQRVDENWVVDE